MLLFGGVDNVDAQIKSQALSKLGSYKEFFTNPFEDEDISAATLILSTAWDITDGAGLKEQLEKLKSGEGEHKAWDWARGVYIAWAGLRAGFITREEVDAYNASLVPLAQAKYADWNAYFMTSSLVVRLGIPRMNPVAQQKWRRLLRIFSTMKLRSTRSCPSSSPFLSL